MIAASTNTEIFAIARKWRLIIVASAATEALQKSGCTVCNVFTFANCALVLFDMRGERCAV